MNIAQSAVGSAVANYTHFLANFPWRVLVLAESAGRAQTITEYQSDNP